MEHFFEEIDGWFDYEDLYREAVNAAKDMSHFVELGTWKGRSAAFMGVEIANSGKLIRFDTIDHFIGVEPKNSSQTQAARMHRSYEECRNNLSRVPWVNIIPLSSRDAARLYADRSLDFVFIDANHAYPFVRQDITLWLPKVKKGGVLAGHDYTSHRGVKRAVDELLPHASQVSEKCWKIMV